MREGQADHRGVSNVAGKLGKGSSNQTVATLWSHISTCNCISKMEVHSASCFLYPKHFQESNNWKHRVTLGSVFFNCDAEM